MSTLLTIVPGWLPGWLGAGAAAGSGFAMIKWLLEFTGMRIDKRAEALNASEAAIDASTVRLIAALEKRLDDVTRRMDQAEADLRECTKKHAASEAEVMALRAMMQGYGVARDQAQVNLAADRIADRHEAKGE